MGLLNNCSFRQLLAGFVLFFRSFARRTACTARAQDRKTRTKSAKSMIKDRLFERSQSYIRLRAFEETFQRLLFENQSNEAKKLEWGLQFPHLKSEHA